MFSDPSPWTVQELGRELDGELRAEDAVRELAGAGLVHRLVGDFVVPTRAARRADDLHEGRPDGCPLEWPLRVERPAGHHPDEILAISTPFPTYARRSTTQPSRNSPTCSQHST